MSGPLLAIDTATDVASVAIGTAQELRAAAAVRGRGARAQSAQIVRLVDQVLQLAEARLDELAGIVVGDGPGSFTGLRIGWAAAKGLAHERGIPIHAVPALMGAAAGAGAGVEPVAACFDALRGQVYGALYVFHPNHVETLVAPAVLTIQEFARVSPQRPRAVVGDGALRYAEEVAAWSGVPPLAPEALPPVAVSLLGLVAREGAARAIADPATAEPVYGRPAEAQVKWEARHRRPLPDPPGPAR